MQMSNSAKDHPPTGRHRATSRHRSPWFLVAALAGFAVVLLQLGLAQSGGVANAQTTKTISVSQGSLTGHECNATEWHFIITQIDTKADAPATIHVTWANGASEEVALSSFTGHTAHYITTDNLDSTVVSATADIYEGWSGTFVLSHGPCPTPTTTPPTTPTTTPPTTPTTTPPTTPTTTPPTTPTTTPPTTPTTTPPTTPTTATTTPATTTPVTTTSATTTPATTTAAAATSTSPFVPGAGQTGDTPPGGGFPLRQILIGLAIAMLGVAGARAFQLLRRSGSHT
jgi:hypothetical protein